MIPVHILGTRHSGVVHVLFEVPFDETDIIKQRAQHCGPACLSSIKGPIMKNKKTRDPYERNEVSDIVLFKIVSLAYTHP